jgi:hypothetical protein
MKKKTKEWSPTRVGVCECGHTGGREKTQHKARYNEGHGACMVDDCECDQYTWGGWKEEK